MPSASASSVSLVDLNLDKPLPTPTPTSGDEERLPSGDYHVNGGELPRAIPVRDVRSSSVELGRQGNAEPIADIPADADIQAATEDPESEEGSLHERSGWPGCCIGGGR